MQRFELVAGASAKFWEVGRDDVTVTVRFGRLGTAGQARATTFGSVAEAEAHLAKLVAEKATKGYRPIASMSLVAVTAPVETVDEESLVLPDRWRAAAWPRRDREVPVVTPARPGTELDLLRRNADALRERLHRVITRPDVRAAGLAYLDARLAAAGGGDDPFGAAVLIVAAGTVVPYRDRDLLAPVADDWVARLGYGFAAAATVELGGLALAGPNRYLDDAVGVVRVGTAGFPDHYLPHWFPLAVRTRVLLAAAGGPDRDGAVAALTRYRAGRHEHHRALTSFLLPDRLDWVAADCVDLASTTYHLVGYALGAAAHTADQVRAMTAAGRLTEAGHDPPLLATLITGVGTGIAPVLSEWVDRVQQTADVVRQVCTALALVPTDEAFRLLLSRADHRHARAALLDAIDRFPVRALRLLAAAPADDRAAAGLLRSHVLGHPDLVERALPGLPAAAAARVRSIVDGAAAVAVAAVEALPPVLADPPWARRKPAAKPVVVGGLTAPVEAAMAWEPGEREAFLALKASVADLTRGNNEGFGWAELAATEFDGRSRYQGRAEVPIMVHAPDEVTRPRLAGWVPRAAWQIGAVAPALAGRYELDVLPTLLALTREHTWDLLPALMPYASSEVAVLVAGWYGLRTVRADAAVWLRRHPGVAARALVPAAVGKVGVARRNAERALRVVAGAGHRAEVLAAAADHGTAALGAVQALIDTDPVEVLPARPPAVPDWLDPALQPQVVLANGAGALPPDAVRHLCTVFALSTVAEPYAGVAQVVAACDPESLAGFWWEAFTRWRQLGYPKTAGWVLQALGLVGNDETVRRLAPLVRVWPGEGGHTRAVAALDVLAAIGTDVALMHLNGIATSVKFAGLRERAQEKITEVAAGLGLTAGQLADRLVPDFGLGADGSLVLDFGPRSFTVGFDERLRPYVVDGSGARRAALPKPAAKDDPDLATAAVARFAALRKDVRTVAADQLHRWERAMVTGREWTGAEFRHLYVGHPLLVHLVRRLVWVTGDGASFRVAEDRTFADVDDEVFTVADDDRVRVAHPLDLGDTVTAWSGLFADYELLPPFRQLDRETYALTDDEAAARRLDRWTDVTVPTTRLLALERRGWRRGAPEDNGVQGWLQLPVGDLVVVAEVDPGIVVGDPGMFAEQRIVRVWLKRPTDRWWVTDREGARFGVLGPVAASELLRDLTEVTS
ncbi:DUF4132 domain-containing protein [Virgisporangium ochraceum]|uniref:WGR domain-containing protein n=1 Tax=Virgisporangium ochraceum TaxID=65505 RepID=A0A8J4EDQ3_9ACTN|nr:DUF4132 domain-containing protein [Virgisporangium ochraceum]GIJ70931.1 hypothetical protein Voc01_058480 [Virgisporangium ochraceum]